MINKLKENKLIPGMIVSTLITGIINIICRNIQNEWYTYVNHDGSYGLIFSTQPVAPNYVRTAIAFVPISSIIFIGLLICTMIIIVYHLISEKNET